MGIDKCSVYSWEEEEHLNVKFAYGYNVCSL